MSFQITPAAAREILAAAERSGCAGMALRVAASLRADGLGYAMGFDEPAPGDEVSQVDGLTVLVGADSRLALGETVLDYVVLDDGTPDFVFLQPAEAEAGRASTARGCSGGRCTGCH